MDNISDDATLMAIFFGLRPKTRFWWSVHKDGPMINNHEFLSWVEKHIRVKEVTSYRDDVNAVLNYLAHPKDKRIDKKSKFKQRKRRDNRSTLPIS